MRLAVMALTVMSGSAGSVPAQVARVGALEVDYAAFLSRNDVVYLAPARQGWEGLPLGNGRLGAQVWQPDGISLQLNTALSGVYGGGIARLHLKTSPGMLTRLLRYEQRLSLHTATIATRLRTEPGDFTAELFILADADALVIDVTDARPGAVHRLDLETWRSTATTRADNGVLVMTDLLPCHGEPDYRFALAVALTASDVAVPCGQALQTRAGRYTIYAVLADTRDPKADVAAAARATLQRLRAEDLAAQRQRHTRWWHNFWSRSLLHLHSDDGVADYLENAWYMHLYALGAGSRGEVPPKFNGGLWTWDRDVREWGSSYWHWNQQEATWPLFAANHLELHAPYQNLYFGMLPEVKKWTREMYGLEGAQFQETIPFHGRMPRWATVKGVHPRVPVPAQFGHTNAIFSSSAEIAMQFWWYWRYTGDEAFLRDRAYPLMKEVALFYLGYLEKDSTGRYVMWPSNAHESFWRVKNPTTDLAAIRYLFPRVIQAAERLGADPDLRQRCREVLEHLAPYPKDPEGDWIISYELQPGEKPQWRNAENPRLFPIGVFPLLTLGTPDYALALRTFRSRQNVNCYGWHTDAIAAARLGLADDADTRRLFPDSAPDDPKAKGLEFLLPAHVTAYQNYPCGLMDYYPRTPAMHYYLEGSGTFATACNEMLLQSWHDVIRVAPALPRAWNARFTLLAFDGFLVSAECEKGRVRYVALHSQRGATARLVNPFGRQEALARTDHQTVLRSDAAVLQFPTQAGKTYIVAPASQPETAADRPPITGRRNDAPKGLGPKAPRRIGLPASPTLGHKPAETNPPSPPAVPQRIDRPATPTLQPVLASAVPTIDADLNDPVWTQAQPIGPFALAGTGAPAQEPTDVRLACDAKALYVAVTAWESRMDFQLTLTEPGRRDWPLDQDDSVSLLVRPISGLDMHWHLAVNPLGARYDALVAGGGRPNVTADPAWSVAVRRWSNRWTIEAALPLEGLAPAPPGPGAAWAFRVERNETGRCEHSAFPTPPDDPKRAWAAVVFAQGMPAPAAAVEDPHLVAWWPGEVRHGVWVMDQSGRGLHGFAAGRVRCAPGKTGPGLLLEDGFVEVPDSPLLRLTDGLTLMAWVRPKAVGSMRLIDKCPAGRDHAFLLDTHPENHVRWITRFGALSTQDTLPVDQWTHLAVTFDGQVRRIYLNGQLKAEAPAVGKLDTTELPLRLGADSEAGSRFVGLLDEVRIYNRGLEADTIRRLAGLP